MALRICVTTLPGLGASHCSSTSAASVSLIFSVVSPVCAAYNTQVMDLANIKKSSVLGYVIKCKHAAAKGSTQCQLPLKEKRVTQLHMRLCHGIATLFESRYKLADKLVPKPEVTFLCLSQLGRISMHLNCVDMLPNVAHWLKSRNAALACEPVGCSPPRLFLTAYALHACK